MKTVAYCALHYGKSYLAASIRSIIDSVDEYHVLYTERPSHGSSTDRPCPDNATELYQIALDSAGVKLRWHTGQWQQENDQRNSILMFAGHADAIFIIDSDEIYPDMLVHELLVQTSAWHRRYIRVPFVHFYRNFQHCIIRDPAYPIRLIYPQVMGNETATAITRPIVHMGYCQPAETIRYKLGIHGHRLELRCGADEYVDKIYLDEKRWTDLHPIGSEYWNAEVVNPLDYMPSWMQEHPFYGKEVIE